MKDEEYKKKKDDLNYQYPKKYEVVKEEFEIVLVGQNFLVLKDGDGNNIRVKYPSANLYKTGEKIYKEDGNFSWEMA